MKGSVRSVAEIVLMYCLDQGKQCFTYSKIKSWYYRRGLREFKLPYVNDRTLDRNLRELALTGLLERWYIGRSKVVFKVTHRLLEELGVWPQELADPASRKLVLEKYAEV